MDVIYGLMPAMVLLGLISVFVFFWAVKNGQYDDMEGPAHRILDDDDLIFKHPEKKSQSGKQESKTAEKTKKNR